MPDHSSVGYWVRRFLLEYLPHERGFSKIRSKAIAMRFAYSCRLLRANLRLRLIDSSLMTSPLN